MEINDLKQLIQDPTSPDDFQSIQAECEDLLQSGDPYECQQMADYLGEVLQTQAGRLQGNAQMYEAFQSYWHRLAFKAFVNMPANVKADLLSRRLLYAVSRGYNPDELIQKYFEMYDDKDLVKNVFTGFVKNLEDNTETLGSNSLSVEDKKFLPQVKNWIYDYSKFPSLNARRSNIDRLNYVNQSQNVRPLTQGQRQALLKILKLYDDMLNPEPQMISSKPSAPIFEAPQPAIQIAPAVPRPPAAQSAQQSYSPVGSVRFAPMHSDGGAQPAAAPQPPQPPQPNQPAQPEDDNINRKLDELKKRVE